MRWLTTLAILTFPLIGCSTPTPPVVDEGPLFCDVEEKRKFSQAEIDWRAANAPWNLTRDFRTNLTWERECEE